MAIITAAGLTDLYNQRAFNKNGSTVTLKKISETDWLLFGDLAEGDSEGFATEKNFSTSERSFSTSIQIVTPPTAALSVVATADAMQMSNCEIIPLLYGSSGTQLAADGCVVDVSPFPPDLIGTIDPNTATFLRPLIVGSAVQDVLAGQSLVFVAERRAIGAVWLTEEDEEVFVIEAVIDYGFPFIMRDGFNFAMNPGYVDDIPLLPEGLQNLTAYCSAVYDDTLGVMYAEFPECSLPAD